MSGLIGGVGSRSGIVGETEIDYEEGSWYTEGGSYLTTNSGKYTKIGNRCFCTAYLATTSGGSATSALGGLPFVSASATESRAGGVSPYQDLHSSNTVTVFITGGNDEFTLRLGADYTIAMAASKSAFVTFSYQTA